MFMLGSVYINIMSHVYVGLCLHQHYVPCLCWVVFTSTLCPMFMLGCVYIYIMYHVYVGFYDLPLHI